MNEFGQSTIWTNERDFDRSSRQTDGQTDRHSGLQRCEDASKKIALIGPNCTLVHDVIGFIDQSEAWKMIDTVKELQVKRERGPMSNQAS